MDRRMFLSAAALAAVGAAPARPISAQSPATSAEPLFHDPDFTFTAQIAFGHSYHRASDPGKVLQIAASIPPGDFEAGFRAYHQAGLDARALAEAASARHRVSARQAYLWAATYFACAMRFLDSTDHPERIDACFAAYADCWAQAVARFDPPAERIEIPYEKTPLTGWLLRVDASRRPLLIVNNGADGMEIASYAVAAPGIRTCAIFDWLDERLA